MEALIVDPDNYLSTRVSTTSTRIAKPLRKRRSVCGVCLHFWLKSRLYYYVHIFRIGWHIDEPIHTKLTKFSCLYQKP